MLVPTIISLHYTAKCDRNCNGCYLKSQITDEEEIPKNEWLNLPKIASQIGATKIAIALNYINGLKRSSDLHTEIVFLSRFVAECKKNNILVDITSDSYMAQYLSEIFESKGKNLLSYVDVYSISIDDNKEVFDGIDALLVTPAYLKAKGVRSVNANMLITPTTVKWIVESSSIVRRILKAFNTMNLVLQKPLIYTKDEFYEMVSKLESKGIFKKRYVKIDPCLKLRLGLIDACHGGNIIIDINQYGSISGCAFNHQYAIGKFKRVLEIPRLLENVSPQVLSKCEHLEFKNL